LRALFLPSCFRVLSCMNCLYASGAVMYAPAGPKPKKRSRTSNADVGSLTGLLFAAWTITQSKILALVQFANIPVLWALAIGSASPADGQSGRYPSRQR